mmetsp:Transcript_17719/g.39275  ORF Transcript_17719/g.39275 Transcript_17719/m.39275 type:complete len:116 (-) Transcript_17719:589-936(-)
MIAIPAIFARLTFFARTGTLSIKLSAAIMVERAIWRVLDWVHKVKASITAFIVTVDANIVVFAQEYLAPVAVHVAIGEFLTALSTKEIAVAIWIKRKEIGILPCIRYLRKRNAVA